MQLVPAAVVDRLPPRLWRPGNLYVGTRLHFCIAQGDGVAVRNIEWQGREVARGRREQVTAREGARD